MWVKQCHKPSPKSPEIGYEIGGMVTIPMGGNHPGCLGDRSPLVQSQIDGRLTAQAEQCHGTLFPVQSVQSSPNVTANVTKLRRLRTPPLDNCTVVSLAIE